MPQAIAAAVVAVADYAAAAATGSIVAAGLDVSFSTALLIEGSLSLGIQAGIYVGISAGVAALTAPSVPKPEAVALTKKQPIPSRQTGWGRARLGGAYMLYEGNRSNAWVVLALHDGQVDGFEQFYLHDDRVILDGSGWANSRYDLDNNPTSATYGQYVYVNDGQRYAPNHVKILARTGASPETAYSEITAAVPSWSSNCRGDGIASLAMLCNQGQAKYFTEDYPNGLPSPSVVTRLKKIWDPRDVTQLRTSPSTWKWSDNPILALLDYLWADPHGPQLDYTSRLAPVISDISSEATYCDNLIPLKAGGTEKRYRLGGVYDHQNHPADVIKQILSTMDGWIAQRGDGALIIKAGRYDAPTVTLSSEYILSYSWSRYVPDEEAVNTLDLSFCSPLHNYSEIQTDSWTDDADIAQRGVVRSQSMSLPWVQSNAQARRLAKRRMSQLGAQIRGTVKANLYGMDILENRYFTLNIPDVACLTGLICEIDPNGKPELNLMDMTVTIPWIAADPNVDSWNATLEEGAGVALVAKWSSETLPVPTIVSVVPVYASAADGGGTRLVVTIANSGRADQSYGVRWKDASEVSYVEAVYTGPFATSGNISITTGLVKNNATLDVSVELISGAGIYSGWCSDVVVTTSANAAYQGTLIPVGGNVVSKPSFEDGLAGQWTPTSPGTQSIVTVTGQTFTKALQLTPASAAMASTCDDPVAINHRGFSVVAGDKFFIDVMVDTSTMTSGQSALIGLDGGNDAGTYVGSSPQLNISTVAGWTRYTGSGVIPAGVTKVRPFVYVTGGTGAVRFSNLYIGKSQPGSDVTLGVVSGATGNRVPLSQFEKGTTGWFSYSAMLTSTALATTGSQLVGLLYTGTAAAAGNGGNPYSQQFSVTSGEQLAVSALISTGGNTVAYMNIAWINSAGTQFQVNQVGPTVNAGATQQLCQGMITAPAGAVKAYFYTYGYAVAAGGVAFTTYVPQVMGVATGATLFPSFSPGPVSMLGSDVTAANTAAAVAGQTAWATYSALSPGQVAAPGANLVFDGGLSLRASRWGLSTWSWGFGGDIGPYIATATGGDQAASDKFTVYANNSYTAQVWAASSTSATGTSRPYIYIAWYDASGTTSVGTSAFAYIGSGYSLVTVSGVAPSTAVYGRVIINSNSLSYGSYCWASKFKCEFGPTATPFNDATTSGALYADGSNIEALKPAQAGADVTAYHVASSIANQGYLAVLNSLAYGSTYLTGFGSLAPANYASTAANQIYSPTLGYLVDAGTNGIVTGQNVAAAIANQAPAATDNTIQSGATNNLITLASNIGPSTSTGIGASAFADYIALAMPANLVSSGSWLLTAVMPAFSWTAAAGGATLSWRIVVRASSGSNPQVIASGSWTLASGPANTPSPTNLLLGRAFTNPAGASTGACVVALQFAVSAGAITLNFNNSNQAYNGGMLSATFLK